PTSALHLPYTTLFRSPTSCRYLQQKGEAMLVQDILKSKASGAVHTITPSATVTELLDAFAEHNIGALVVSTDGVSLQGIVYERDVVRRLRNVEQPGTATVEAIMSTKVETCAPDDPLDKLAALMTERRVRHIPVLQDGSLVGVVSIGDAVKAR